MSDKRTDTPTALVTGASSGIGLELARLFARDGYDVVLVSRSEETLAAIGDDLESRHGIETTVVPLDLSEPGSAEVLYDAVREEGLVVDALVNNAGFSVYGRFTDTDLGTELDMIRLHVETATHLTKLFVTDMAERGSGEVLVNASTAGFVSIPTAAVYSATKNYLLAFSEALAIELEDAGVAVTVLCPGETDTAIFERGNMDESALVDNDLMDPATVARAGYEGLQDGETVVVPGRKHRLRLFFGRLLPRETYARAAKRLWNE